MKKNNTKEIFEAASRIDETLRVPAGDLAKLTRKRVLAAGHSRNALFRNQADGKISLFHDYSSPLLLNDGRASKADRIAGYLKKCNTRRTYRVQAGRSEAYKYYSLKEIVEKWQRKRALLSITDLHIRNSRMERFIDPGKLSTFNLYCECDDPAASLEMMTMVISSAGNITDSHTDDSDGSNHCFVGRKLWLAWDTHEGLKRGLQDVERNPVQGRARFDMQAFLSLPGSRWLVVEDGQTLFLPGHLTHKVITLENYIGVGSFYVSFPNCLRTLSRWILHAPNWEMNESPEENEFLTEDLIVAAIKRYKRSSRKSRDKDRWGVDYLQYSVRAWERLYPAGTRKRLLRDGGFRACYEMAAAAG